MTIHTMGDDTLQKIRDAAYREGYAAGSAAERQRVGEVERRARILVDCTHREEDQLVCAACWGQLDEYLMSLDRAALAHFPGPPRQGSGQATPSKGGE